MLPIQIMHHLKEARERAGLSLRTVSRRTGISISELQKQEESNEVSLVDLWLWQDALDVPIGELFGEPPETLSEMNRLRTGLLRIMRSVRSLLQTDLSEAQEAYVRNIETKLRSLMPELEDVRSWPVYGERRPGNEPTRTEARMIATAVWFPDIHHES